MTTRSDIKNGDSVRVKDGVEDPDSGICIAGWQGRATEVDNDDKLITVEWDSVTLRNMESSWIEAGEIEGLDWATFVIEADQVERAKPRDTPKDTARQLEKLQSIHRWDHLGEQGKRISSVLQGIDDDESLEAYEAWEKAFRGEVVFPYPATVTETPRGSPLRDGDKVEVTGIEGLDDDYGVIARVKRGRETYDFPLCDMQPADRKTGFYTLLSDYNEWFANR